jgi:hypothetical protein
MSNVEHSASFKILMFLIVSHQTRPSNFSDISISRKTFHLLCEEHLRLSNLLHIHFSHETPITESNL